MQDLCKMGKHLTHARSQELLLLTVSSMRIMMTTVGSGAKYAIPIILQTQTHQHASKFLLHHGSITAGTTPQRILQILGVHTAIEASGQTI